MHGSRHCALVGLLICFCMELTKVNAVRHDVRTCTTADNRNGYCVNHYLCVNGIIETDGDSTLTPKIGGCPDEHDVPQVCCLLNEVNTQVSVDPRNIQKCGIRNRDGVGPRALGTGAQGPTLLGELPWSVALFSTNKEQDLQDINGYFCGGTLIHPSVVLTATHCFNGRVAKEVLVRVGDWNIHDTSEVRSHQEISVKEIITHEGFYDGNKENDVALLILSRPAKLDKHIAPICLPKQNSLPSSTSTCFAAGWGRNIDDFYPSTITKMKMEITDSAKCQELHRAGIPNPTYKLLASFICASSKVDRCAADGGSPLVCSIPGNNNTFMQYGILSWASGCNTAELPAIYTSVAKFRLWIDKEVSKQGFDPAYFVHIL